MNEVALFDMWQQALRTAAVVSAPFLATALGIGLLMSLLQAATQMQENAIAFVPKLIGISTVLALTGPWALDELQRFGRSALTLGATTGSALTDAEPDPGASDP